MTEQTADYLIQLSRCATSYEFFKKYHKTYLSLTYDIIARHFDIRAEIIAEMSRYAIWSDFLKHGRNYYVRLAQSMNMRPIFYTIESRPHALKSNWLIYQWTFNDGEAVYIGLTKDLGSRIKSELRTGTIKDYIAKTGSSYSITVLEHGLTMDNAAEMEKYYIVQARIEGKTPINKMSGGGVGASIHYSDDELIAKVKQYKTLAELRNDQALLCMLKRRKLYKNATKTLARKNRREITYSDAKRISANYTKLSDFMRDNGSVYNACRNNGWDDILNSLGRTNRQTSNISVDEIKASLSQCKTRTEFNKRFRTESYTAKKLGIYADLVKDIPKQSGKAKNPTTVSA